MTLAAPERTKTVTDTAARLLADTFRTSLMAHNFHWNVTGPMFGTLHERFELIYTELDQAIDEIAERIRTLGAPAPGSFEAYGKLARVDDPQATAPEAMIREMVSALETTAETARALVDAATAVDDPVSADLGTRRADVAEKSAWLLRSYLQ